MKWWVWVFPLIAGLLAYVAADFILEKIGSIKINIKINSRRQQ